MLHHLTNTNQLLQGLLFLLLGLLAIPGHTQVFDDNLDRPLENARIRAQRVAYITERLNFTPQEAERFWPLFNEMEAEKGRILLRYDLRPSSEQLSEEEATRLIENSFLRDEELLALRRRYYERFRQVIAPSKLALFPRAEREFKRDLLEELRRRRQEGQPPRRG